MRWGGAMKSMCPLTPKRKPPTQGKGGVREGGGGKQKALSRSGVD